MTATDRTSAGTKVKITSADTIADFLDAKFETSGATLSTSIINPGANEKIRITSTAPLAANVWGTTGNSGTSPGTNYVGTSDEQDLVFKTNNIEKMRITTGGLVGISTGVSVLARLHVDGDADQVQFRVDASTPQTADMIKWRNATSREIFTVDGDGYLVFGGSGSGTSIPFKTGTGIIDMKPFIDDVPGGAPSPRGMVVSPTWEYTAPLTSAVGISNAIFTNPMLRPASGLGAGTDTHNMRGMTLSCNWTDAAEGRTLTGMVGATLQGAVANTGTITTARGALAQIFTSVGGTLTKAIGFQASGPFTFLGGSIVEAISLNVTAPGAGTTKYCLNVGNADSFFEGKTSFGGNFTPNFAVDAVDLRVRATGHLRFSGTGASDSDVEMSSNGSGILTFAAIGGTNNETFNINMESVVSQISLNGGNNQLLINFNSFRVNGLFAFGTAPTPVQTGYIVFANLTTRRTLDADSTSVDEIADFCGTLRADLVAKGLIAV